VPRTPINGVALHYQRVGAGPEIVLLHGLTANLAFWHPAIVHGLAEAHAVTLLDFRGHGRSDVSASGYTTRDLALDVAALLDHLGVDRAVVAGHSFGGAVALHLAALRPARVEALVLADARVRALQPAHGLDVWEQWPRIRERLADHGIAVDAREVERELGLLETLARLRLEGRLDGVDLRPFFIPFATGSRRAAERWLALSRDTAAAAEFQDVAGLTREVVGAVTHPALLAFGALSHCRPTQAARRAGGSKRRSAPSRKRRTQGTRRTTSKRGSRR
jgi:pimeloyl-ACP methyl ester carboxylesterase